VILSASSTHGCTKEAVAFFKGITNKNKFLQRPLFLVLTRLSAFLVGRRAFFLSPLCSFLLETFSSENLMQHLPMRKTSKKGERAMGGRYPWCFNASKLFRSLFYLREPDQTMMRNQQH
jgi:hypothetical protein